MRKERAVHIAGVRGFSRGIKWSIVAAVVLLAWDGALTGSYVMSSLVCPIWFLASLLKNAIERPWGLALVRIGFPVSVFGLVWANSAVQIGGAEANAQRVVAACEKYQAANGKLPENLHELVPEYLDSAPVAKHCFMWNRFLYFPRSSLLGWYVVPPYMRKTYNFDTRTWRYLD